MTFQLEVIYFLLFNLCNFGRLKKKISYIGKGKNLFLKF